MRSPEWLDWLVSVVYAGVVMEISSVSASDSLRTAVQVEVMKKANEQQAQQARQLIEAQARQQVEQQQKAAQAEPPPEPGKPGSVINTYA